MKLHNGYPFFYSVLKQKFLCDKAQKVFFFWQSKIWMNKEWRKYTAELQSTPFKTTREVSCEKVIQNYSLQENTDGGLVDAEFSSWNMQMVGLIGKRHTGFFDHQNISNFDWSNLGFILFWSKIISSTLHIAIKL